MELSCDITRSKATRYLVQTEAKSLAKMFQLNLRYTSRENLIVSSVRVSLFLPFVMLRGRPGLPRRLRSLA